MDQADGVYAHYPTQRTPGMTQKPWELTSQTLQQYRVEDELRQPEWIPPVPSQDHDPFAGAYPPPMETNVRRNNQSQNASFRNGARSDGQGNISPSGQGETYMVPPKFGWRTVELGIVDFMSGVYTKVSDPQNPVNSGYPDDFSGGNGGYTGSLDHNSMTIPQGL